MEYYNLYITVRCIWGVMAGSFILMLLIFFIDALWKSFTETRGL